MDTLILNRDGSPLSLLPMSVLNWQEAIRLLVLDKVHAVKNYEDWIIRSPSITMHVPSVVMTKEYVKWNRMVKYSRSHILLRDRYKCQLCGKTPPVGELTLDHVIPRSKGGKTTWENIVTSCKSCNERKGNDETIVPAHKPVRPSYYQLVSERQKYPIRINDEYWQNFLGWPQELVQLTSRRK
jgi:5-methylcytosine-specific restriction endonuclease McrA